MRTVRSMPSLARERLRAGLVLMLALVWLPVNPWAAPGAHAESDVSFSVSQSVSDLDEWIVREGITLGERYGASFGGGEIPTDLIVNVRNTSYMGNRGTAGFTSPGFMAIFSGSGVWRDLTTQRRVQVVVHEYIHAIEFTVLGDDSSNAPYWFIEGLAEYLSYDALLAAGIFRAQDVDDYFAWSASNTAHVSALETLENLERDEPFYATRGAYEVAYLAIEHLVELESEDGLAVFMNELTREDDWEDAFERTFDMTPEAFYVTFAESLDGRVAPAELPESFLAADQHVVESPVRISSYPDDIEPGDQMVILGKTEPNATCVFSLNLTSGATLIAEATFADANGQIFWLHSLPTDTELEATIVAVTCGSEADSVEIAIVGEDA